MTEPKTLSKPHTLVLENKKKLQLTGITDVGNFNEYSITIYIDDGELCIKGENLHIESISLEKGEASLNGQITSVSYVEIEPRSAGFFSKIFK
ncbi:MAG: sporulation protein YabP [Oscillospiraceae bacterium]|jgi:sporulation protein YabP|nr:sporulation protein YabP [Oscillospiraceae bacterium]